MFGVCSGVCFLLSGAMLDAIFPSGGSTIGICTIANLWSLPVDRHKCNLVKAIGPHQVCTELSTPSTTLSRGEPCATQSAVPQPSHIYRRAYSIWGLGKGSHLIPLPFLHGGEGSSLPGLVPSNDTVDSESAMGIKPDDSGLVIGYHVDAVYSHLVCRVQFVAHSHIYPGLTGKVSSLTHCTLEPGCEDYSFLDQTVADFEQGLDSILTNSLETQELDIS